MPRLYCYPSQVGGKLTKQQVSSSSGIVIELRLCYQPPSHQSPPSPSTMLRRQALRCLQRTSRRLPRASPRCFASAAPPSPNDAFANGTNAYYVDEMYRHWKQDPKSVHVSWDVYFSGMDSGLPSQEAFQPPPSFLPIGGAPTLEAGQAAKLDDHLKVYLHLFFPLLLLGC